MNSQKIVSPSPFEVATLADELGAVLLRPHEIGDEVGGSDFDFLCPESHEFGELIEEQLGDPLVKIERTYVHQRFYEWGQVDVLPKLEWNGFAYTEVRDFLSQSRVDQDGVSRLRQGHDGMVSWVTSLLWGGFFKEKYESLITSAACEDGDCMKEALKWAFGERWALQMMQWATEGSAGESALHVGAIRRALIFQTIRREGGAVLRPVTKHWLRELKMHWKPTLPLVAFLGPDGSGKSSMIAGVCKRLDQMRLGQRMMHWRPYGLKGREVYGAAVANPHGEKPRGVLESIAKLGMLWWDWWLPYLTVMLHARAKTTVVVSDRYYMDLLVDPIRYRYGARRSWAARAFRFFPKPDLVFVLTGDAEVIHPRKEEVSFEELEGQLARYEAVARQIGEKAVLIDVNQPLEGAVNDAWEVLKARLSGKPTPADLREKASSIRPLRVGQFVPHYPSLEGLTAYCRGLSREMTKLSPGSCPIITLRTDLDRFSGEEELLHYPHKSRNPMSLPRQLIEDLESNTHGLDGIALHGPYHPKIAMLRRHLTRLGIPYIFVPHDPYVPELTRHHGIRKFVFWHLFEKHTIRKAEAVQILASEHEKPLRDLGFEVPVEVIPNGCEFGALSEIPKSAKIPGSTMNVRIQYMGRMDRNHKGLDLLIMAFARYLEQTKDQSVELVLTGHDWEDRQELEEIARKTCAPKQIIFTGPRPEHSLAIHSEADLVVLPSRFDGFGLTIVEAMLASRPVLVSKRAGAASHVETAGGGWTFEPVIEEISKAIKTALEEKKSWEKMGKLNNEYVTNFLTWEQTARKTLEVYRKFFR